MPIPRLTHAGFLPIGIHDCNLDEVRARFSSGSARREKLFEQLTLYLSRLSKLKIALGVFIDGSFVTNDPMIFWWRLAATCRVRLHQESTAYFRRTNRPKPIQVCISFWHAGIPSSILNIRRYFRR